MPTPTLDALAAQGFFLKYNAFSTTALCSPTRAAADHRARPAHTVHTGIIMERSLGYPGYNSLMPKSAGTVRRNYCLRQRLQHRLVRQEPQCAGLAEQRAWPL